MLKRTITYEDFDGNKVSEVFYFNLTRAELIDLELSYEGGLEASIKRIIEAQDNRQLVEEFKRIVLMSYGVKSEDGKRFIKSDELREQFKQTLAYDELFMELASNEDAAAAFIAGILPKGVQPVQPTPPIPVPAPPQPEVPPAHTAE